MKIIKRKTSELIPYPNNPRKHPEEQILALMKAITEFGFDQPIVMGVDGVIIKGHGRHIAAQRLGMAFVPVVVKTVTANEARLLRVSDNEVVSGDWDYHALKQETNALFDAGMSLELTGFSMKELNDLPDEAKIAIPTALDTKVNATTHQCKHCGYVF